MYPVPKPNFKRRAPKQATRNEFKQSVRMEIYERDNGLCRQCGAPGEHIHHVLYRSRGGRGVYTNGLTLCHVCHTKVHTNAALTKYWLQTFVDLYGEDFYKDEWD